MTTPLSAIPDAIRHRIAGVLFLAQSFYSASTIAAFTLSPIIAADLSGTESAAGMPNTLTLIGRAAFAYPLGWLMDRLGRRLALAGGYGFAIFGALLSAWAIVNDSYLGFLAGALLFGMARSAGDQSRYVAAEVYPLHRRAKIIGIVVFAGTIGAIGGPALVAPSGEWVAAFGFPPPAGPFLFAAVAMTIATLTVFVLLRPDPLQIGRRVAVEEAAADPLSVENNVDARPLRDIFAAPLVRLALLSMVLGYFVMAFLMVITPVHMDHHDYSSGPISTVIMWHTLGMFGLSWFTGWLIDRFGRIPIIMLGGGTLVLACLLAPLSLQLPVLSLALFLLGLGWNFCFIGGSSLLSDALSAGERGRAQGTSEGLVALAAGGASFSVGFVFERGDYLVVSLIGLFISLAIIGAAVWLSRTAVRVDPSNATVIK